VFCSVFWIFLPLKVGLYFVPKKLPSNAMAYLRREETSHDNLVMQSIVVLHMVTFQSEPV